MYISSFLSYLFYNIIVILSYILFEPDRYYNSKIIFFKLFATIRCKSVNLVNNVHDRASRLLSPFRVLEF